MVTLFMFKNLDEKTPIVPKSFPSMLSIIESVISI